MPRDDTAPGSTIDDANHKAPLKRGDACLYCRKRRIRCSADKPSCQHCTKLKRECVYDTGKPVSRVKQLEDKVAELEDLLKLGASGAVLNALGNASSKNASEPPPLVHHSSSSTSNSSNDTFPQAFGAYPPNASYQSQNQAMANGSASFGMFENQVLGAYPQAPSIDFNPSQPIYGASGVDPAAVDMFDFSTLDPGFVNLINALGATSTGPSNATQMQHMNMQYASTGMTPFLDPTHGQGLGSAMNTSMNPSPQSSGPSGSSTQPISLQPTPADVRVSYHAFVTEVDPPAEMQQDPVHADIVHKHTEVYASKSDFNKGSSSGWKSWVEDRPVPDEMQGENALMGGWFDPTDLPKVARDHLLDLFFSGMRMFGQEFHIPRFFASLSLPLSKRPHPCLLYTMYLVACRISTSVPIRSLETHFYKIAMEQLEESIAASDRLFDAVRAATILSVYKYSLAKYHEGWMMGGRATRLAISCGLHAIPSSVWKPCKLPSDGRADLIGLMRQRSFVLPPPADSVALGERIWAFWSVFMVDRAGAISTQWPSGIADVEITTPYPRPLQEYELGLVSEADDISLSTLYAPDPLARPLPHYSEGTYMSLRMRGMALLDRASKLIYLKPEKGMEERLRENSSVSPPSATFNTPEWLDNTLSYEQYLTFFGESPGNDARRPNQKDLAGGKGWMRCAKVRTPKAYQEVYDALMRAEMDMPPERRTNWEVWDGNVQDWHFGNVARRELAVLHFVLGCSWMFLFDIYSFNSPNDLAVGVARRLAYTVRATSNDNMQSDLDVFIAMTWSFIVKILIRESKRLHAIGDHQSAAPIEEEIEVIVRALQKFGKRYSIATYQAERAKQFQKATKEDTEFMEDFDALDETNAPMPGHPPGTLQDSSQGYA